MKKIKCAVAGLFVALLVLLPLQKANATDMSYLLQQQGLEYYAPGNYPSEIQVGQPYGFYTIISNTISIETYVSINGGGWYAANGYMGLQSQTGVDCPLNPNTLCSFIYSSYVEPSSVGSYIQLKTVVTFTSGSVYTAYSPNIYFVN